MIDAVQQLMAPLVSSTLDDRRRLRAARPAVGRDRTVLPRAVDEPVGRRADVAGAVGERRADAGALGVQTSSASVVDGRWREPARARLCPRAEHDRAPTARGGVVHSSARGRRRCVVLTSVGTGFLPKADEGGFVIDYLTPAGSALEETDRHVRAMERVVSATPEVASYSRRTGSELGLFATAQNTGDILVRLKPRSERGRSAEEIIADMRPRLQAVGAARRDRVRPAAAGHARRSRGEPDADRGQDLR